MPEQDHEHARALQYQLTAARELSYVIVDNIDSDEPKARIIETIKLLRARLKTVSRLLDQVAAHLPQQ